MVEMLIHFENIYWIKIKKKSMYMETFNEEEVTSR